MKKQYRVRVTTYFPSFVVEAENEEQAKELGYIMPWPHADACSFFEVEEDKEDVDPTISDRIDLNFRSEQV